MSFIFADFTPLEGGVNGSISKFVKKKKKSVGYFNISSYTKF